MTFAFDELLVLEVLLVDDLKLENGLLKNRLIDPPSDCCFGCFGLFEAFLCFKFLVSADPSVLHLLHERNSDSASLFTPEPSVSCFLKLVSLKLEIWFKYFQFFKQTKSN